MKSEKNSDYKSSIKELLSLIAKLRDPILGCPWDLDQTHESLIPYVIEEAYEVVDSIRSNNLDNLKEELGDLLLQIILHSQIANESNKFSFEDVVKEITTKIIRRHPHVFENNQKLSIKQVNHNWEKIKNIENNIEKSNTPFCDNLKRKIRPQPALYGAMYISKKTAKLGFEWDSVEGVLGKVEEELQELKEALRNNDHPNAEEELGDLLFTIINLARWYKLDPEKGLHGTNKKFIERFSFIESFKKGNLKDQTLEDLEELWQKAKKALQNKKD